MPTILTDPHHLPLHPFMDWFFFKFCKNNDIPIGLFYRDIYWLFETYSDGLNTLKRVVAKTAYWFDLWVYQQTLSKLYLPSLEMGRYIPLVSRECFQQLPPGHHSDADSATNFHYQPGNPIRLFYVGGLSSHYQLHTLFEVVCKEPRIELTICTREPEWLAVKHQYPKPGKNIRIVHLSDAAMESELKSSDIAVLYVKPQEYWEFASPVKLYEYLGHRKPILASKGTLAGSFVQKNGLGWTLPYEAEKLTKFFSDLLTTPSLFAPVYANLNTVAREHTWQNRANQVIEDLTR